MLNGRSHVERKWGVSFVNCAQLFKFHGYVTCPPMSRHFTFTEGSRLVRVRYYLHPRRAGASPISCRVRQIVINSRNELSEFRRCAPPAAR